MFEFEVVEPWLDPAPVACRLRAWAKGKQAAPPEPFLSANDEAAFDKAEEQKVTRWLVAASARASAAAANSIEQLRLHREALAKGACAAATNATHAARAALLYKFPVRARVGVCVCVWGGGLIPPDLKVHLSACLAACMRLKRVQGCQSRHLSCGVWLRPGRVLSHVRGRL